MSVSQIRHVIRVIIVTCLSVGVSLARQAANLPSVTLSPGSNIQAAVSAHPEGTKFVLLPGLYRKQSVTPKNGDIFIGQGNVVLNGSQVLSFESDPAGSEYWVASATASMFTHGSCQKPFPLCVYSQDLFIDNVLQTPATTSEGLQSGSWYFDRAHNKVYVPINPTGHMVELGMASAAFSGSSTGVQISQLTVEKYAAPAQTGAVGGNAIGTGWVVNKVESRWNHGRGISLGFSSQLLNSFIHHNGQLGVSLRGANSQVIGNEISWNNYAGYSIGFEAGGSKFSNTTGLVVKSNYVHDNMGPGLWTDANNVGTLYDSNTVVNNLTEGIVHEISYNATISNNVVKGNGNRPTIWLWNTQILVQNSSNVQVYGNTVEVPSGGGNGIAIINQKRASGTLGPWVATNNYVHNNTITYLGNNGLSGIVDDTRGDSAVGNRFDLNHYILKTGDSSVSHWVWFSAGMGWTKLQALEHETHGVCCK